MVIGNAVEIYSSPFCERREHVHNVYSLEVLQINLYFVDLTFGVGKDGQIPCPVTFAVHFNAYV